MARLSRSVAAFGAALVSGALLSIGCALSAPPDTSPMVDPSLPEVDAAFGGRPAMGDDAGTTEAGLAAAPIDAGKSDSATKAPLKGPDAGSGPPPPTEGEVLITEVQYNPLGPEPRGEWFEITNRSSGTRSLSGLYISDGGGRTHVIAPNVVIAPGAYVLMVRDIATATSLKVPAAAIFYEYGTALPDNAGILLLNGATGSVSIHDGATMIAQAPYGGWFSQSGGSTVQLKVLDFAASAQQASWCISLNPWTTGSDKGTPGAQGDCP